MFCYHNLPIYPGGNGGHSNQLRTNASYSPQIRLQPYENVRKPFIKIGIKVTALRDDCEQIRPTSTPLPDLGGDLLEDKYEDRNGHG